MDLRAADEAGVAAAAARLRAGGLVAFPTETVYGLGADATNGRAVAAIYELKGRPSFNPLIVHVPGVEEAAGHGVLDDRALALAARFWPGPLTLVVPRRPETPVSELVSAGLDTVALRAPAHPVARALLHACDRPLAAPSANPSGCLSPTTAAHVATAFGESDLLVLDGGPCMVGLESTVVELAGVGAVRLLRAGAVTAEEIAAVAGPIETAGTAAGIRAPGMLESHYAPRCAVRLNATAADPQEALLAFGRDVPPCPTPMRNLSPTGDLREAAANLFAMLHELDCPGIAAIAVMPIPEHGLGVAINDRLRRAAAAR